MPDPAIIFLKPGAISKQDRNMLRKEGVLVVEIDDPSSVKFVRAHAEMSSSDMLRAAMRAVTYGGSRVKEVFTNAIAEHVLASDERTTDHKDGGGHG